jgi:hypothetical protein
VRNKLSVVSGQLSVVRRPVKRKKDLLTTGN